MSKKNKIRGKTEQNKAQHDIEKQTARIFTAKSRNISKYEFLTSEDVLSEKDLLVKAAITKRFKYWQKDKKTLQKTASKIR